VTEDSQDPAPQPESPARGGVRRLLRQPVLYPEAYTWYIFVSSLDLMFTALILAVGGAEVNVVADWIIGRHDLPGLVVFKFLSLLLVVAICEFIGRRRRRTGAALARAAVIISAIPVIIGGLQLLAIAMGALNGD
jgi:hypothetical protein